MLFIFCLSLEIICIHYNQSLLASAENSSYIPAAPSGPEQGYSNTEYTFIIQTTNPENYWRFDWGEGTMSTWVNISNLESYISCTHIWNSSGTYQMRIQQKNKYSETSIWSPPLTVIIVSDLDKDGWTDEMEQSYNTNISDPQDRPLDTDNDGIPDNASADAKYLGDLDDDNDGLSDEKEINLGSNQKKSSDVLFVTIEETMYYLVDTDANDQWDVLYNLITDSSTRVKSSEINVFFLDVNGDAQWDYTYYSSTQTFIKYEEKTSDGIPLPVIILSIILLVILIILVLIKTGVIYIYEEYTME
ncbi:MAG: hypothetical protein NT038_00510 [Euryarchaeota archaeon]|nr:hypothetical protein [Euryarchaeota archaeon]